MIAIRTHRFHACALLVAMLALPVTAAAASGFIDLRDIGPVHGDAGAGKAKATVCMGCHGAVGVSPVPLFPNLAGQHAEYLYWQLVEIKREARPESPMTAQVANLDDSALRDLATYFSSLPAMTATTNANAASMDRGGKLYREGDPATGVPPCQGCHGASGEGHPLADEDSRWRTYPLLRGQHSAYMAQRLKDFRDGKHTLSSNDRIMMPIARALDDASIEAVTQWIESGTR
jgi:cytochrome c553